MSREKTCALAAVLVLFGCEPEQEPDQEYSSHTIVIYNSYESNGHDNYQDVIEVNFKLEYLDWMWLYELGSRVEIVSDGYHIFNFTLPVDYDSVYVSARFWYQEGPEYLKVEADTTIKLDHELNLVFVNCSDSTDTEYPFEACWSEE